MNAKKCFSVLTLTGGLLANSCFAETSDAGFYFGLGAGAADYSMNLDQQIRAAYEGSADYRVVSTDVTDDTDGAYHFMAGYRFLPWLSFEAAWSDLGQVNTAYELVSISPDSFTYHYTAQGEYHLRGLSAALNAEYALGEHFAGLFRLGAIASRLDYQENGVWDSPRQETNYFRAPTKDQVRPFAGLGLNWHLQPNLDLRLDWNRYFGVGSDVALTQTGNGRFAHVDQYALNLIYRLPH